MLPYNIDRTVSHFACTSQCPAKTTYVCIARKPNMSTSNSKEHLELSSDTSLSVHKLKPICMGIIVCPKCMLIFYMFTTFSIHPVLPLCPTASINPSQTRTTFYLSILALCQTSIHIYYFIYYIFTSKPLNLP